MVNFVYGPARKTASNKITDAKAQLAINKARIDTREFYTKLIDLFERNQKHLNIELVAIYPALLGITQGHLIQLSCIEKAHTRYFYDMGDESGFIHIPDVLWVYTFHTVFPVMRLPNVSMTLMRPKDNAAILNIFPNIEQGDDNNICFGYATMHNRKIGTYEAPFYKADPNILFEDLVNIPSIYWNNGYNNDYALGQKAVEWLEKNYSMPASGVEIKCRYDTRPSNLDEYDDDWYDWVDECGCGDCTGQGYLGECYQYPTQVCKFLFGKDIDWNKAAVVSDNPRYIRMSFNDMRNTLLRDHQYN